MSSPLHIFARSISPALLFMIVLLVLTVPQANTQASEDIATLSYQTFNRISAIYQAGGEARDLVDRLNSALQLIQDAHVKRSQGDEAAAKNLEDQARQAMNEVNNEVPTAQQRSERESRNKTYSVLISAIFVTVISTFAFCVALRGWRWYEKSKLFEMRIVEKKAKD